MDPSFVVAEASDTPVWWLFGATAFLALAAVRALAQLTEVKTDRHLQFLSDFGRRWDDPQLWEARQKQFSIPNDELPFLVEKWFATRDPEAADVPVLLRVPNFFEDLAITVDAGRIDLDIVLRSFGSLILNMWSYWEPAIQKMCETAPTSYSEFRELARAVKRARDPNPSVP